MLNECWIFSFKQELEETLAERLIGLTEMFPDSVRNGAGKTIDFAARTVKS